jgi:hypothetical protein
LPFLALAERMGAMTSRAVPVLPSANLAATLAFYEGLDFENRGAPPDQAYGMRTFAVRDPDGNEIRVGSPAAT